MLIRVKSCHTKDLRQRFRYLLQERAPGNPRDPEKCFVVYRDVPEEVFVRAVEQMERKRTYWSVVVSFHPSDREKFLQHLPEIVEDLVEEFRRGYPPGDRPLIHAVVHLDEDHPHVHFTILNQTEGGRASRWWYYRRDQEWLSAVQNYIRTKYRLVNPRDPRFSWLLHEDRSRARAEAIRRLVEKAQEGDGDAQRKLRLLEERDRLRREIHKVCEMAYLEGEVSSREELVEWLKAQGLEVTRTGRDYITVALPMGEGKKFRIRLRGSIYAEDFRIPESGSGSEEPGEDRDHPSLDELRTRIEQAGQARFREFKERFRPKPRRRTWPHRGRALRKRRRFSPGVRRRETAPGPSPSGGARSAGPKGRPLGVSLTRPPMIFPFMPAMRWRKLWWASWERWMRWLLPFRPPVWLPSLGWVDLTPSLLPQVRQAVVSRQGYLRVSGAEVPLWDLPALKEAFVRFQAEAERERPRPEPEPERREGESVLAELAKQEQELRARRQAEEARRRAEAREAERVSSEARPTRGYLYPGS